MSKRTNLPSRYNPYKAASQAKAPIDSALATRWKNFKEKTKETSPKLYDKIQRQEAWATQSTLLDAELDSPDMIAFMDSIIASATNNKYRNELAILGIESHATKRDVRNAYRRKARKIHPDAGGNEDDFKRLYAAYRTLLKIAND